MRSCLKILFIFSIFVAVHHSLWAQGTNCSTAFNLGTPTSTLTCDSFLTSSATGSTVWGGPGACSGMGLGGNGPVTWFRFCTNANANCILFNFSSLNTGNMEAAIYSTCTAGTASGIINAPYTICYMNSTGILSTANAGLAPNTCYYIRIRTENAGRIKICRQTIVPPANDACAGATTVTSSPVAANNYCYTPSITDPAPATFCAASDENSSWFKFTSICGGTVTFNITSINCTGGGAGFQIGFYTGSCTNLTNIGCNSGTGGSVTTTINNVTAGQTIYILIDGNGGAQCTFNVSATNSTPGITPSPTLCAGDSVTLTATGGGTYLWSPGGQTTASITVAPTVTTAYSCIVNSCQAFTVRDTVFVNPKITPLFTPLGPFCSGTAFALPTSSTNGITGTWSPAVNTSTTTTYTFTPAAGQCANTATMTVVVNPANIEPLFTQVAPVCSGTSFTLPLTSSNGIAGSWSPALNNTTTTTYVFTPTAGQCADTTKMTVTVNPIIIPTFTQVAAICRGGSFSLPIISNNGISGSWSPAINNQSTTVYTFTPANGQCATTTNMTVTVNAPVTPTFPAYGPYCRGDLIILPTLPSTSNNGIVGTWSPASISTAVAGNIVHSFTPNAGQCANSTSITVVVNTPTTPLFNQLAAVCFGTAFTLPATSTNGINGTWSPAINNTATTVYTFTPNAGSCANTAQMTVTVTPKTIPLFNQLSSICAGQTISLPSISLNGITGTWTPAINNQATTTYTFIPSVGQCAADTVKMTVSVIPVPIMNSVTSPAICSNTALAINLSSNIAGTNFTWQAAANTNVSGVSSGTQTSNQINDVLINNSNTAQIVTYSVTPQSNGCPGTTQNIVVTIQPVPVVSNISNSSVCSGTALSIGLSSNVAGAAFSWYAGSNALVNGESTLPQTSSLISDSLINTITAPTQLIYTVSASVNGCTGPSINFTLTINPAPAITSLGPVSICSGDNVNYALSSNIIGSIISWNAISNGNVIGETTNTQNTTLINNQLVNTGSVNQLVQYNVNAIYNGCPGQSVLLNVTVKPSPIISNAPTKTICSGSNVALNLTSIPSGNFAWNAVSDIPGITGETMVSQNTNVINDVLVNAVNTVQTVSYSVTPTANGCPGTPQIITVSVNPVAVITSAATIGVCSGLPVGYSIGSNVSASYSWSAQNNPNTSGESTVTQNNAAINDIIVNNTFTSQAVIYNILPAFGGCAGTPFVLTAAIQPAPLMSSPTTASVCSGATMNFALSSNIQSNFTWQANDNSNVVGESLTAQNTAVITNTLTNNTNLPQIVNYFVTPVSDPAGCAGLTQTVQVTVLPSAAITSTDSIAICSGGNAVINFSSNVSGATYQWIATDNISTIGESIVQQSGSVLNNTITNNTIIPQTVNYLVTPSANGCVGVPQNVKVLVFPTPLMSAVTGISSCSGVPIAVPLTSNIPSVFTWIANNNPLTTGESIILQNSNNIGNTIINTSGANQTVQYTITPFSINGNCPGLPVTLVVTVHPAPVMTNPTAYTICGNDTLQINLTSNPASNLSWLAIDNPNTSGESILIQTGSIIDDVIQNTSGAIQVLNYQVTPVSQAYGCTGAMQTITVAVNPSLNPAFSYPNSTFCQTGINPVPTIIGNTGGVFSFSPAGLSINSNTGIVNLLSSTLNTYTIKYSLGGVCPASSTVSLTITNAPQAGFSYSGPFCTNGANPIPVFNSGASAGVFTSTPAGLVFANNTTGQIDLAASTPGNYSITNTIAASGGCAVAMATNPISLVGASTLADAGGPQTVCGPVVTMAANTALIGTGTWSLVSGAGTIVSPNSPTTQITGLGVGNNIFRWTISATAPCAASSSDVIIHSKPIPVYNGNDSVAICSGAAIPVVFGATLPSGYIWSATDNPGVSGESTGIQNTSSIGDVLMNVTSQNQTVHYSVVPSSGGCTGLPFDVKVTVKPVAQMTSADSIQICSGQPVGLTLSSNISSIYKWVATNNPNIVGESLVDQTASQISDVLTSVSSNNETVMYTVTPFAAGCSGIPQQLAAIVKPLPQLTGVSTSAICSGDTLNIALNSNIAATYQWQAVNNPSVSGASLTPQFGININDILISNLSTNTVVNYTVTAIAHGCQGPAQSITATVHPSPIMTNVNALAICSGNAVGLSLTSNINATYQWMALDNPNTSGETILSQVGNTIADIINNNTNTDQLVQYDIVPVSLANGCTGNMQSVIVTVHPYQSPVFSYSSASFCQSGVDPSPVITGMMGGSFSATPAGMIINPVTGAVDLSASNLNSYTIQYNTGGVCPTTSNFTLSITDAPHAGFGFNGPYCQSGADPIAFLNPGSSAGIFSAAPAGMIFVDVNTGEVDLSASLPGTYTIYNTIPAAGGCAVAIDSAILTIASSPSIAVAGSNQDICTRSTSLAGNNPSVGTGTWTLISGAGVLANPSLFNTQVSSLASGPNIFRWTISGSSPCPSSFSDVTINVRPIPVYDGLDSFAVCSGDALSIPLSANIPSSFMWHALDNPFVSGESINWQTSSSISDNPVNLSTSTQAVIYQVIPSSGTCTGDTAIFVLMVSPSASMTNPGFATICSGGSLNVPLTSNIPANYFWVAVDNPNTTGESIIDQNSSLINDQIQNPGAVNQTVIYSVTPVLNGCGGTPQIITVIVKPLPIMSPQNDTSVCDGALISLLLSANMPSNFTYVAANNPNVVGEPLSPVVSASITYALVNPTSVDQSVLFTVTPQATGCSGLPIQFDIVVKPTPVMTNPGVTDVCSGNSVGYSFTSNIASDFQWWATAQNNVAGETIIGQFGSSITDVLTNNTLIPQTVQYHVTPWASGCSGITKFVNVNVNPIPVISGQSATSICSGAIPNVVFSSNFPSIISWSATDNPNVSGESISPQTGVNVNDVLVNYSGNNQVVNYLIAAVARGCSAVPFPLAVTVLPVHDPSFQYGLATYCQTGSDPIPTITGTSGGAFTVTPSGLSINGITGAIDVSASALNTYTISYGFSGVCPSTSSQIVTVTDAPNASFSFAGPYCQQGSNPLPTFPPGASAGIFSASPAGLSFTNSVTGEINVSASVPGTYVVTNNIAAAGGCAPASATDTIVIVAASTQAYAGTNQTICGSAATLSANTPMIGSGSWTLLGGLGSIANPNDPNTAITLLGLGQFTFRWTIDATSPCLSSFSDVIITVVRGPLMTSPAAKSICSSTNVGLALSSDYGINFKWVASDNPDISGESIVQQTGLAINDILVNNTQVDQTVVYTVTPFAGNCFGAPQVVTITVHPKPVLNSIVSPVICSNSPLNISLISAVNSAFSWSAIDNNNTIGESISVQNTTWINDVIVNNTAIPQTVNYNIGLVSLDGCPGASSVLNVLVNPAPVITNINSPAICSGQSLNISLNTNIPSSFSWMAADNPNTNGESLSAVTSYLINDVILNPTLVQQVVQYSIQATSVVGNCKSSTQITSVAINPLDNPSFNYALSTICRAGGNQSPVITGLQGGAFSAVPSGLSINPSTGLIVPSASAVNTYQVTYQTNGNCPMDSTITLQILNTPKADFQYAGPYCTSGTDPLVLLNAGAIHGLYTASPAGLVFLDNSNGTIDLSSSLPGNYFVTNTIGATLSCPAVSSNAQVSIVQAPNLAQAGSDQFVCDATATITANAIQGGTANWSLVTGTGVIGNPTIPSTVISGLSIGENIFSWNVQGNYPCPGSSDSIKITRLPKPEMTSENYRVICSGTPVYIPLASNIPSTYSWVAQDNRLTIGESISLVSSAAINNTIINQSTQGQLVTYYVIPTSINGNCEGIAQEVTVAVLSPVKAFAGNDTTAIKGQTHQLNATGGDSYLWTPSNLLNNPSIANPITVLYDDARFIVEVSNWLGCTARDTVFVKVYEGPTYYVPNAFSPNGDGLNDVIRPIAVGIVKTEWFRVYNRWGQLMFETNDWMKGWDGRYHGIPQPLDNYVWIIKGFDVNGKEVRAKGNLLLIR